MNDTKNNKEQRWQELVADAARTCPQLTSLDRFSFQQPPSCSSPTPTPPPLCQRLSLAMELLLALLTLEQAKSTWHQPTPLQKSCLAPECLGRGVEYKPTRLPGLPLGEIKRCMLSQMVPQSLPGEFKFWMATVGSCVTRALFLAPCLLSVSSPLSPGSSQDRCPHQLPASIFLGYTFGKPCG